MVLSVATQLFAQVKTGGGGGPDFDVLDARYEEYKANERVKFILADLTKELIRIEQKCNQRQVVPYGYTFVDSFYSLSLKKANRQDGLQDSDCVPSKKVAKCLDTKKLKEIMTEIKQTPGGILYPYLKKEYQLDEKSAVIILKFFEKP